MNGAEPWENIPVGSRHVRGGGKGNLEQSLNLASPSPHSHIFFCMPLRMTSRHFQQMGSWLTGYVIVGTDVHIMI